MNQAMLMVKDYKCLLIDDDKDDQEIFNLALEELPEKIECLFANNSKQGLEVLSLSNDYIPDVIFIDLNMPKVNGKVCLAKIRELDHLHEVPVIIYSTSESELDKKEVFSLGAKNFITKPSTISELALMLSGIFITLK
jgi:DNA-binding response OmpR family regulator